MIITGQSSNAIRCPNGLQKIVTGIANSRAKSMVKASIATNDNISRNIWPPRLLN